MFCFALALLCIVCDCLIHSAKSSSSSNSLLHVELIEAYSWINAPVFITWAACVSAASWHLSRELAEVTSSGCSFSLSNINWGLSKIGAGFTISGYCPPGSESISTTECTIGLLEASRVDGGPHLPDSTCWSRVPLFLLICHLDWTRIHGLGIDTSSSLSPATSTGVATYAAMVHECLDILLSSIFFTTSIRVCKLSCTLWPIFIREDLKEAFLLWTNPNYLRKWFVQIDLNTDSNKLSSVVKGNMFIYFQWPSYVSNDCP